MKHLWVIAIFLLGSCSAGNNSLSTNETAKQELTQIATVTTSHMINKDKNLPKETSSDPVLTGIDPERIEIPLLEVDALIDGQGLNKKGQMEVPDNGKDVGWFELGVKPGARGNAVIAGHVDDYKGPAVFFYLKKLKAGDLVHVYNKAGEKVSFKVERVVAYEKDEAPIREIFGPSRDGRLNLITCTGLYDRKSNEHEKRLVVYTKRIDS
ncbi:sortase [Fictibacillus nanhaiensis]|uniref:sortase domain-containing protein n=1 Tax=Fictibacillus nanhaiensis TaxID=742169 RepID=UPI001C9418FD|nr:sortase [Fictibacillus nanhaiensis]MBY6037570.1 sortase [Fictibacillus nanhaiensis]